MLLKRAADIAEALYSVPRPHSQLQALPSSPAHGSVMGLGSYPSQLGVSIGDHTAISGCTAIAGSTRVGTYCLIGGAVGIVDNIVIADQVEITAMSLVSQSIPEKGRYSSGTGLMPGKEWKRSIVGFRKLDELIKRIRRLEKKG